MRDFNAFYIEKISIYVFIKHSFISSKIFMSITLSWNSPSRIVVRHCVCTYEHKDKC